jgi:hypothetical protein
MSFSNKVVDLPIQIRVNTLILGITWWENVHGTGGGGGGVGRT